MPFSKVDISGGQVSGVSDLSSAPSSAINWHIDQAGVSTSRSGLSAIYYGAAASRYAGAGGCNGLAIWADSYIVMVFESGDWFYSTPAAPTTAVLIAARLTANALQGNGLRPTFVVGENNVYATNGSWIKYWSPSGGAGSFAPLATPQCTHIATLGQYLIANDVDNPSRFKWTDIGEGSWGTWPAANFTAASAEADPVVALAVSNGELWVWGSRSLQVYQIGSDPALPFDLISSTNTGLVAPYCYVKTDEGFAFMDDRHRIVLSDGRTARPISDAIQSELRSATMLADGFDDAFAYREDWGQHSYLIFRFPLQKRTFVYETDSEKWHERKYYLNPIQEDYPAGAVVYNPDFATYVVGPSSSVVDSAGHIGMFYINPLATDEIDLYSTTAVPIVCERTTGWHDHGTANRKRSIRLRAVIKRGTAVTGTVPSAQAAFELRTQDDDKPWSEWRSVNVGTADDFRNVKDVFGGGIFRRRRYGIRFSSGFLQGGTIAELQDEVQELAA